MNWEGIGAIAGILAVLLTLFLEWPKFIARFENVPRETLIFLMFLLLIIGSFTPILDHYIVRSNLVPSYTGISPVSGFITLAVFNLVLVIVGIRTANTSHLVDYTTIHPLLILTLLVEVLFMGAMFFDLL